MRSPHQWHIQNSSLQAQSVLSLPKLAILIYLSLTSCFIMCLAWGERALQRISHFTHKKTLRSWYYYSLHFLDKPTEAVKISHLPQAIYVVNIQAKTPARPTPAPPPQEQKACQSPQVVSDSIVNKPESISSQ